MASFDPAPIDWLLNATVTQWINLVSHPHRMASRESRAIRYRPLVALLRGAGLRRHGRSSNDLPYTIRFEALCNIPAIDLVFPDHLPWVFVEYWPIFPVGRLAYWRLCAVSRLSASVAIDVGLVVVASLAFRSATRFLGWGSKNSVVGLERERRFSKRVW